MVLAFAGDSTMTSDVVPAAGGGPSSSSGAAFRPRPAVFFATVVFFAAVPVVFFAVTRFVVVFLAAMSLSEQSGNPRRRLDHRIRRPPSSNGDRPARCGRR